MLSSFVVVERGVKDAIGLCLAGTAHVLEVGIGCFKRF
jgi:hypothetical protein